MAEDNQVSGQEDAQATLEPSMAAIADGIKILPAEADSDNKSVQDSKPASGDNVKDMQEFIASNDAKMKSLASDVTEAKGIAEGLVKQDQQKTLDSAVDNAVSKINEGVNGDADMADLFLNKQYKNDPNFRKIFDSRDENPAAYEKATAILKEEWKAMNENRIDPQIAENQRALMESQRPGQSVQQVDEDTRLSKLPDGEFMRHMRSIQRS